MRRRGLLLFASLCAAGVYANAQSPIPAGVLAATGHAAQDSAPARAFAALLQAAAKNDFAAIRPMLVPGHPGLNLLNPAGFPMVKAELLPGGASPAAAMATLTALYTEADTATLVFGSGQTIWKMQRQAGGWKLSP
jgi:hypothetical protein